MWNGGYASVSSPKKPKSFEDPTAPDAAMRGAACRAASWQPPDLDMIMSSPRLLGGPGFLAKRRLQRPCAMVDFTFAPMEICVESPSACMKPPSSREAFAPSPPSRFKACAEIDLELDSKADEMPLSRAACSWPCALTTPSSCSSMYSRKCGLPTPTPRTPEPKRDELTLMSGDVCAIVFDFDGTLTASPGEVAIRGNKQDELCDRSSLLAPRLQALRGAGITLCIMSKSSETTIRSALQASGLAQFFDGPLVAKAVGFEGKAGFIKELVQTGDLQHLRAEKLAWAGASG